MTTPGSPPKVYVVVTGPAQQLSMAMKASESVIPKVFEEWEKLSGRKYNMLETYKMEDAETAIFIVNSAADTVMEVVDKLRAEGKKVGCMYPTVIRPFPAEAIREACKNVKALLVGDRADSYGAHGGRMSHEVKAALKVDPDNKTLVVSRIYGLGGKDFFAEDAEGMFNLTFDAVQKGKVETPYDYIGISPGDPDFKPAAGVARGALWRRHRCAGQNRRVRGQPRYRGQPVPLAVNRGRAKMVDYDGAPV